MAQRIICIVGGQRAGTTALQNSIKQTRLAVNFGEIFQPTSERPRNRHGSFLEFARLNQIEVADMLSVRQAYGVAKRFTDWLRIRADRKHVVVDIKLNSWLALSPAWQYPHDEPLFLTHLKREDAIFIFIWRENLADQILSLVIAQKLGIWHNLDRERVGGRTIHGSISELERLATLICRSEAAMHEHLLSYSSKLVVRFEDALQNGVFSETFRSAFKDLLGFELSGGDTGTTRANTVNKHDIISNYAQACEAINGIVSRERKLVASKT
jgi:hypothetical protein